MLIDMKFFFYSQAERSVSTSSYQLGDPPPPYPGKTHETTSNYLPSYESAVSMERRRQEARERESLTERASRVSVEFSISSDHFDVGGCRSENSEQISGESTTADGNSSGTVVPESTISLDCSRTENTVTECEHSWPVRACRKATAYKLVGYSNQLVMVADM